MLDDDRFYRHFIRNWLDRAILFSEVVNFIVGFHFNITSLSCALLFSSFCVILFILIWFSKCSGCFHCLFDGEKYSSIGCDSFQWLDLLPQWLLTSRAIRTSPFISSRQTKFESIRFDTIRTYFLLSFFAFSNLCDTPDWNEQSRWLSLHFHTCILEPDLESTKQEKQRSEVILNHTNRDC